ncbi:MAG: MCE family protein, partial [Bacteroidota bacterium]|nr:MCE family protein [Bacteroidota bacterium]
EELASVEPVETDAIMESVQITAANAEVITEQLAEIMLKINEGEGTLGRLIQDTTIARNIDQTILNLKKSSKGLDENMEAAKHNFLLKGFFNKKKREAERKAKEAEARKAAQQE